MRSRDTSSLQEGELELGEGLVMLGCRCPEAVAAVDSWELKRFKRVDRIGDGMASRVYSAVDLETNMDVALKAYNLAEVSSVVLQTIMGEIAIHSKLDHPHIAQLWAAFRDGDFLCVIMPLATNGDLYSRFKEIKHDERSVAKYVLMPVLSALGYLHRIGVLHRDIKLENILLDRQGHTQLADFGFALSLRRKRAMTQLGTLQSMAPEVILGDLSDPKGPTRSQVPRDRRPSYREGADVWALGVMFWELVTGTVPFNGHNEEDVVRNILAGHAQRPEFIALTAEAQDFLNRCLRWYPDERSSIEDLYGHPLIVQHADPSDWNRLHPAGTEEGGGNMESNLSTFSFVAGGTGLGPGRARAMANNYSVARGSQTGNAFRIVQRHASVGLSGSCAESRSGRQAFTHRNSSRTRMAQQGYSSEGTGVRPLTIRPRDDPLSQSDHNRGSKDRASKEKAVNEDDRPGDLGSTTGAETKVIAPVARDKSSWGNKAENGDEEGSRAVDITAHPSPAPPRRSVWRMLFCFRFPTARGGAVVVPGLP